MKHFRLLLLAVAILFALVVTFAVARTGLRLYALNKVLRLPAARQRLGVMPGNRALGTSALTNRVNLGYAAFSIPTSSPSLVQSGGSAGTMLVVSNNQLQLVFLPPFSPQTVTSSPSGLNGYPRLASHVRKWQTDPIAAEVEVEQAHELPILNVATMSQDEFLLYSSMLGDKACFHRGRNQVYSFTTPHIKGLVRIGDNPHDRKIASASIASSDGRENVGFHLYLASGASTDIGQVLDAIFSSFHFTTDSVSNGQEISNLIYSAGIRRRPDSQPED